MDIKITYRVDTHIRTLVFPGCDTTTMMDDGKGNLLTFATWGERYFLRYGAKDIAVLDRACGDFAPRRAAPCRVPQGAAS
jgi:hypothetical protein